MGELDSKLAFNEILTIVNEQLQGRQFSTIYETAQCIIDVLKDDAISSPEKEKFVNKKLLTRLPKQIFQELVSFGERIQEGAVHVNSLEVAFAEEKNPHVEDIDADWLPKKISQALSCVDSEQCQKLAEEVLMSLADDDDMEVERKLFWFDNFSFIEFLLRNRLMIVWCTRLARAKDQYERNRIEDKMHRTDLQSILEQLDGTDGAVDLKVVWNGWLKFEPQLLNLDGLAFAQGEFYMEKMKCDLPIGSYTHFSNLYEEIHVQALDAKPFDPNENLVEISSMPDWVQPAFKGMTHLNRIQSKVYETALFKPNNLLLCAPSGAGKINISVLTILRQIALHRNADDGSIDHGACKIVHVAPLEAVEEVVRNLCNRLQDYDVQVRGLKGDQSLTLQQIEEAQIIVTAPENLDMITRKSGQRVKLLIIDEIHLLHDNRGPFLESIVARTGRQINTIRLVGFSAPLPDYEDVASFLCVNMKNGLFYFDNSYRHVPLSQRYIGIKTENAKSYQMMNDICYEKVMAVAGKHRVLIFVHSSKETAITARAIRDTALANNTLGRFLKEDSASCEILRSYTESEALINLLSHGFAIHHDGMTRTERQLVEDLFAGGHVQVLVATATLAWGVNLAAHTVIIKGTQIYNPEKGAWTELRPLDVMQMLGCAGCPQHDLYGEGIIVTRHSELQYYLSLMNQQFHIESQFVSKLADHLNTEIVLGNVRCVVGARDWIGCTYLYFRMLRNPSLYGLASDVLSRDIKLKGRRADLIHSAATILDRNNLIKYDRRSGNFQATDLGRIASYYHIRQGTISTYKGYIKQPMGYIDLYQLFSQSEEFQHMMVRQDEKMELEQLLNRVPIPIKESLEERIAKINVLIQAYVSRLEIEGISLSSDMVFISQKAGALLRAFFKISLKRGRYPMAMLALNLSKMVSKRRWSSETALHQFPKLNLAARVVPVTCTVLRVELKITPDFSWDDEIHGYIEPFWVMVVDFDGNYVIHYEYFMLKKQYIDEDHTLIFTVPIYRRLLHPQYFVHVVSDTWVGSRTSLPLSFNHLTLPMDSLEPTEVLDLQPLPVTALGNPLYEALYRDFEHFNPVQKQVFPVLYESGKNVLVAAPTGSGKTTCAEFAILRGHKSRPNGIMRVVYVSPIEALAKKQYHDWKNRFGIHLELRVVELTGETATDLELLQKGQIIISTPKKWIRLWEQSKHVQVSLFIIDELHLIGRQGGPVLEVIVSRMRYFTRSVANRVRMVGLSSCVANGDELGEWLGASKDCIFTFPCNLCPLPLETHIQGVDIANFEERMEAMIKLTCDAIFKGTNHFRFALLFVPSTKHVQQTAMELIACKGEFQLPRGKYFDAAGRRRHRSYFSSKINKISNENLKAAVENGVGYLHEGLNRLDLDLVTQLFEGGRVRECVVSSSMCWEVTMSADLVVVMGTQYSDGPGNAQTDFPITDLLKMMDHAKINGQNKRRLRHVKNCLILCHAPRKDYYKKFSYGAFPVESHLHHFLHDYLNAEISGGIIQHQMDAMGYLTMTFLYKRMMKNPYYYDLEYHDMRHFPQIVENILTDLADSKCIAINENKGLSSLSLGKINYTTVGWFSSSLTLETDMKRLLWVLSRSSEYRELPIRSVEAEEVRQLSNDQITDSYAKANALLQAHFSRKFVGGNLLIEQREVLVSANRLLQAMLDVISSNGWLRLALLVMKVSQMVTQGLWNTDSVLLQLPHFSKDLAKECQENPGKRIETVYHLLNMKFDEKSELLGMSAALLVDIDFFCYRYPNIALSFEVLNKDDVWTRGKIRVRVNLERERGCFMWRSELGPVDAPTYPEIKKEGWWLLVGESLYTLHAIKFITEPMTREVELEFAAPPYAGRISYTLYFICDSYLGCDQEHNFTVDVYGDDGECFTKLQMRRIILPC